MNTLLIADSGSTKTEWRLCMQGETAVTFFTGGINPVYQDESEITNMLTHELKPRLAGYPAPERICFYGAGCIPAKVPIVEQALQTAWAGTDTTVEVQTDMLGAARSLCGHSPGIVCILGTGSNSCEYDGRQIIRNVPPLGFILGDEGSGASLGKRFVAALLKGLLPTELKELFLANTGLTQAAIIERVYRQPLPNRFLAGFAPFIAAHIDLPSVCQLVMEEFDAFFRRNVSQYDCRGREVHFTGSIAWHFRTLLTESASQNGICLGQIVQAPMDGLERYHRQRVLPSKEKHIAH